MKRILLVIIFLFINSIAYSEGHKIDLDAAETGCSKNDLKSCLRLAVYHKKKMEPVKALPYFGKVCEGGDWKACQEAADIKLAGKNLKEAMLWLRKSCRNPASDGLACAKIAELAASTNALESANLWFKKACAKGHTKSCDQLKSMSPAKESKK